MEIYSLNHIKDHEERSLQIGAFTKKNNNKDYYVIYVKELPYLVDEEALSKLQFYNLQHMFLFKHRNGHFEMLINKVILSKESVGRANKELEEDEIYISEIKELKNGEREIGFDKAKISTLPIKKLPKQDIEEFKRTMAREELEQKKREIESKWNITL